MSFEVKDDTLFGQCRWCEQWVPRDTMVSVNVRVYGKGVQVVDVIIRLRMCSGCFDREIPLWKEKNWDGEMHRADEIRADKKLADKCDLVDFEL